MFLTGAMERPKDPPETPEFTLRFCEGGEMWRDKKKKKNERSGKEVEKKWKEKWIKGQGQLETIELQRQSHDLHGGPEAARWAAKPKKADGAAAFDSP